METNVNYTVAGIFVIVLTACIVLAIIWLSSGISSQDYTLYKVYMKESVSGLSQDAPVEFNGVNVGTVTKIQINRRNPQLVQLLLKIQKDTPVTVGTRAKLGTRALTGISFILLEDKGLDMRPLVAAPGQPYPIINTTPSLLVRLDTTLTQLTKSFEGISTSIQSLLDNENLNSIRQILVSGRGAMNKVETQAIPEASQMMFNLNNMTRDLSEFSAEVKQNPSILVRGKRAPEQLGPGE